jgi:hypothetical protein
MATKKVCDFCDAVEKNNGDFVKVTEEQEFDGLKIKNNRDVCLNCLKTLCVSVVRK